MIELNYSDIVSTLQSLSSYFIALGIIAAVCIIAMIAVMKLPKPVKFLIRCEAGIAIVLAVVVVVNLICTGPMYTLLSLVSGNGSLSQETSDASLALAEQISDEGIVLLQNDGDLLPLTGSSNINVFGWASTNPVYGGTGSGSLNDAYHTVSLLEGLANAGFQTNTELTDFYTAYREGRPEVGMWSQEWTLPEPPANTYSDELMSSAKSFSDTALIVFSRPGGEHIDLPKDLSEMDESAYKQNSPDYVDFPAGHHYLELSQSERDLVELVCANFDNVVVIYNGANTLQMDFVDDFSQIKSVLWCHGTGNVGFNSLGRILKGTVNPSGKAADTFITDFTQAPYWNNFGYNVFDNMDEFAAPEDDAFVPGSPVHFVDYVEGIYVGYKYYETAAEEGFIDYDELVKYPFGHGLSYTTFSQEMGALSESNGTISFDVTVTNTGSAAGKDVVEVYYNPPYTNGGIEKASANLIAFDKTDLLAPGASQTLTISFNVEDMASYDMSGNGRYVLESGDYIISINSDSHNVIDSQTYTVASDVDYSAGRSTDLAAPANLFDFADGGLTYLSRADGFANFDEATAAPSSSLRAEDKALFVNNSNYEIPTDASAAMPVTGANNGMKAVELRGAAYDDARWDTLLDNLTLDEMNNMIALGGYQTAPAASIDKVATTDCDGPAALNNNFTGVGSVGFPTSVMIACTWNEDLARAFGEGIAAMADDMDVSGWYAPAMNIHRNPLSGRNFEYYSEDGYLSGVIAASAVQGAREHGVYAYMKHFALNDTEDRRNDMICVWANEQAIREIYLKPFELCVKDGGCQAAMSSFNYIGTTYAGGCNELLNNVLRDEWGFRGFVLTDYYAGYGYQDADQCIRNGNDMCLATYDTGTNYVTDTTSATSLLAMRQAVKNILFTVVNSRAYETDNLNPGMPVWRIALIVVDVVLAAAFIALELLVIRSWKKKSKAA